jgi:hypothetical protein
MKIDSHNVQTADSHRRDFLKKTAGVVGAASLAAGTANMAHAAPQSDKKLQIGVFGLDYTFWGLWGDLLDPEKGSGSFFNMEPAYVWDKDIEKAEKFATQRGCEVVKKYDGMLGKVDGVVNGGFYNVPWQHKMLRPYIEAGIPTYLSRPWSSCFRDLDEMLDLAAMHNTPLIATATYEHYDVADHFQRQVKNIGQIDAVFATCGAGDRPHFHVPYMMMKILGYNVEEVSMMTNDPKRPSYLQSTYVYGEKENQPSFALSMHGSRANVYSFRIIGRQGTESASMPGGASYYLRFASQLRDIQRTIEKKENYQPLDIIRKKFECVITEYYSHYERGGAPVKVGTVSPDWQYLLWRPNWYNDSDFKS